MKIEFHDSYFLFVLAGLWALCFLRPLLRCVGACAEGVIRCAEEGWMCETEVCDDCGGCALCSQNALLLVLFVQPVVLGGIGVWARAEKGEAGESTVYLVQFEEWKWPTQGDNTTALVFAASESVEVPHLVYSVDYLFFVLPFAFSVSVSSILLVHLVQARLLSEHTAWDDSIDSDILLYEGAYAVELFCLNLSFFAGSSSARPLSSLLAGAGLLTILQLYFVATSRFPRLSTVEHNISSGFLLMLCLAGCLLWSDLVSASCTATSSMGVIHIALTALLVILHFGAQGSMPARGVLRVRLVASVLSCTAHGVLLAVGRNALCSVS